MCYNSAISAFEKGWHWEMALKLLSLCNTGRTQDTIRYSAAICMCLYYRRPPAPLATMQTPGGWWELALGLLNECKIFGTPDSISAYKKGGRFDRPRNITPGIAIMHEALSS